MNINQKRELFRLFNKHLNTMHTASGTVYTLRLIGTWEDGMIELDTDKATFEIPMEDFNPSILDSFSTPIVQDPAFVSMANNLTSAAQLVKAEVKTNAILTK
jgi:hypothetical protein